MYCPHCGRVMERQDGVLTCSTGGVGFSQAVQEILIARFPEERPRTWGEKVGRSRFGWFCPGCGVPLGAGMKCGECGQSIADLLYTLVELHPHHDE